MYPHTRPFIVALYSNIVIGLIDLGVTVFLLEHTFFITILEQHLKLPAVATVLQNLFLELSLHGKNLAIFYFASHGSIKLILSAVLLRGKLSMYPVAIVFFAFFTLYQLATLERHHELLDIVLLSINALMCAIVTREYRILRRAMV